MTSGRMETTALQANDAEGGDLSGGLVLSGIGLSFYQGDDGTDVSILTKKGTVATYAAVPAGVQILTPMFVSVEAAGTTSTDIVVATHVRPY